MNTPNNKRRRESKNKMERAFAELIQTRELSEITVTAICKAAEVNRSTFYANYIDVFDLADRIKENMIEYIREHHEYGKDRTNIKSLLETVKENRLFFKTYFKLARPEDAARFGVDMDLARRFGREELNIEYRVEFFYAGFNAVLKRWILRDCRESVDTIEEIFKTEYMGIIE